MLTELIIASIENKDATNEIRNTQDHNKSISVFNALRSEYEKLNWSNTVVVTFKSVHTNLERLAKSQILLCKIIRYMDFENKFHKTIINKMMKGDQ